MHYTVFLGFEIDAASDNDARSQAYEMVEGNREFPGEVSCVGFEFTPDSVEHLAVALIVLGKSMQDVEEQLTHASN